MRENARKKLTEKHLFGISTALAVLGLFLLFTASNSLDPPTVPLSQLDSSYIGKSVTTYGTLTSNRKYETVRILEIGDGETGSLNKIQVPLFSEPETSFKPGDQLKVSGQVKLYRNQLEILPPSPEYVQLAPPGSG